MKLQTTTMDLIKAQRLSVDGWAIVARDGSTYTLVWDTEKHGWPKEPTWKA